MLDPRYLRYMSLAAHAISEPQPRPIVENDEAVVYAAIIRDQAAPAASAPDAA